MTNDETLPGLGGSGGEASDLNADVVVAPVVVARLCPGADPASLLAVRATTLAVVSPGPSGRYLLDELPGDPEVLARTLAREPWCADARVVWAVTGITSALDPVQVRDPVLGCLTYALFSTLNAARAALVEVPSHRLSGTKSRDR